MRKNSANYAQAKEQTIIFINKNQNEIENVKNDVIEKQTAKGISMKGVSYISYEVYNEDTFVFFDYGSQGMLGGQYWGFYYSSSNLPRVQADYQGKCPLTEAKIEGCFYWRELNGNNFYASERINDNWFFYYMDYDNNRHKLNWERK